MSKDSRMDTRWEQAKADLVEAANIAGVDPGVMAKMAGLESQYDSTARPISSDATKNTVRQYDGVPAMSSAYGYGQITNDTWTSLLRRYGEKYGVADASSLTSDQANSAKYREDKKLQAGMFAELTRENITSVAGRGGDDVSTNIYAYHNLGAGTGRAFLDALRDAPDERIDKILSKAVILHNPGLYKNGSISVSDAYQRMTDILSDYQKYADEVKWTPEQAREALAASTAISQEVAKPAAVLRQGMRGERIGELQMKLADLGYTDTHGNRLGVDNDFGPSTKAAVEAFQRDHNLKADGIAGSDTFKALEEQTRVLTQASKSSYEWSCPARLDDPAHPDNAFYLKTRDLVYQLDQQNGRTPDERSDQLASALTVSARAAGLHRIDQVALSEDASALWGAQRPPGVRDHFFDQHCKVDTVQALNTPMEQSGAQWSQAMQHFQEQQQGQARQEQQVQQQEQASRQASPSMAR